MRPVVGPYVGRHTCMMSRIEMMPSTSPLETTTRWRKPPRAIASAASSRPQSPSANVALDGQVVADHLAVGILAGAERAHDVALGDDAGAGLLGVDDHGRADVVLGHEPRRVAQRAPRRDRQDLLGHRVSHLHGATLRGLVRCLVVPRGRGLARRYSAPAGRVGSGDERPAACARRRRAPAPRRSRAGCSPRPGRTSCSPSGATRAAAPTRRATSRRSTSTTATTRRGTSSTGALRFRLGDETVEAPAGGAVLAPRGTAHTYWNPRPEPARYLLVMTATDPRADRRDPRARGPRARRARGRLPRPRQRAARMAVADGVRPAGRADIAAVLALWERARSADAVDARHAGDRRAAARRRPRLAARRRTRPEGAIVGALIAAWDGWRGNMYRLAVDPAHRRTRHRARARARGRAAPRGAGRAPRHRARRPRRAGRGRAVGGGGLRARRGHRAVRAQPGVSERAAAATARPRRPAARGPTAGRPGSPRA